MLLFCKMTVYGITCYGGILRHVFLQTKWFCYYCIALIVITELSGLMKLFKTIDEKKTIFDIYIILNH